MVNRAYFILHIDSEDRDSCICPVSALVSLCRLGCHTIHVGSLETQMGRQSSGLYSTGGTEAPLSSAPDSSKYRQDREIKVGVDPVGLPQELYFQSLGGAND